MLSRYCNTNSFIHKMNPLIKIICTILFTILTFLTYDYRINIVISILLLFLILSTDISIKTYLKSINSIKYLLIFILLINVVLKNNTYITIITMLRLIYVTMYAMILLLTTKLDDIVISLEMLFSPLQILKVPVKQMAFSIGIALRFIPDLLDQSKRILKAIKNKGIDYKKVNIKEKIKILQAIMIPIFILNIRKSDELADIMTIKLYDLNNIEYMKYKVNFIDIIILLIHIAMIVKGVLI